LPLNPFQEQEVLPETADVVAQLHRVKIGDQGVPYPGVEEVVFCLFGHFVAQVPAVAAQGEDDEGLLKEVEIAGHGLIVQPDLLSQLAERRFGTDLKGQKAQEVEHDLRALDAVEGQNVFEKIRGGDFREKPRLFLFVGRRRDLGVSPEDEKFLEPFAELEGREELGEFELGDGEKRESGFPACQRLSDLAGQIERRGAGGDDPDSRNLVDEDFQSLADVADLLGFVDGQKLIARRVFLDPCEILEFEDFLDPDVLAGVEAVFIGSGIEIILKQGCFANLTGSIEDKNLVRLQERAQVRVKTRYLHGHIV